MEPRRAALLLLTAASWRRLAYGEAKVATASGCPNRLPTNELERSSEFRRIYGKWPPGISLPGMQPMQETKSWQAYHKKKEAGLMALADHTQRWEFWLEQAQIRNLMNFTETGWAMGLMPKQVHATVLQDFRSRLNPKTGRNYSVPLYTTGDQMNVMLNSELAHRVTAAVQKKVAEWASVSPDELEPTSTYGTRVYWRGSNLKTHVDKVETHVLSAVYCVDDKYPKGVDRWPIETDPDLTGRRIVQAVKPGELFFYESAKLAHGRPSKLEGDYSAHVFIHFRPKGWPYNNFDRVYGIPPGYTEGSPYKQGDTMLPSFNRREL